MIHKVNFRLFYFSLLLYASQAIFAQDKSISGFVYDKTNGEALIGAAIYNTKEAIGTITNEQGYFSLRIPAELVLSISYLGYQSNEIKISTFKKDSIYRIGLVPKEKELSMVEVRSPPHYTFGITNISPIFMNSMPSISGKPDVMKILQYTPGIQGQGELSSVIMVRGGNPGENQYLLDNTPLTYVHHLGGFFSVFNPDMINNMLVYKGNFPATLGGKLSSYIEVSQKKGSNSFWQGNLSIGLSDLSFAIEGPLSKDMTFMFTGRKTLIELLSMLYTSLQRNDYTMAYGFHDINAKYSWQINDKNVFQFNVYQGDDYLSYWQTEEKLINSFGSYPAYQTEKMKNKISNTWGNVLLATKLQTNVSSRMMAHQSLSYTRYRTKELMKSKFQTTDTTLKSAFIYKSVVQDVSFNSDWTYKTSRYWDIKWGGKVSWLSHSPSQIVKNTEKPYLEGLKTTQNALDLVLYTDHIIKPLTWLNIRPGLRLNEYVLRDFSRFSIDPRLFVDFLLPSEQALNIGYSRLTQTSQMLFVPGPVMNNEIWFSSDKDIPVAFSNQYNIGWKGFFYKRMFETEIGFYYKTMDGLSAFKEGYLSVTGDPLWKDKISVGGKGKAYGLEFSLIKGIGRWTGMLSYTYARSFRQFNDINQGQEYVFEFDRPHTAALTVNWAVNAKWSLSLSWIYQTGLPYTPAIERMYVPNTDLYFDKDNYFNHQSEEIVYYEVLVYGEKNSARMKDYHRMDFGAQYNYTTKRGRRACWNFSIYNLYARKNPAFYFYNDAGHPSIGEKYNPRTYEDFKALALYQVYYLSLVPMISYKIWFDSNTEKKRKEKK